MVDEELFDRLVNAAINLENARADIYQIDDKDLRVLLRTAINLAQVEKLDFTLPRNIELVNRFLSTVLDIAGEELQSGECRDLWPGMLQ